MVVEHEQCRLYEQPGWRDVTGELLRPGGLELTRRALKLCALPPGARLLDLGCGTGATIRMLIDEWHLAAFGIDRSAELLRRARANDPQLPFLLATGEHLPIADQSVDAILAECSLSTMRNPDAALAEIRRVLRPGGILAISDLYLRRPEGADALRALGESCLSGALPRQRIEELLTAQQFQIQRWEDQSEVLRPLAGRFDLFYGAPAGELDAFDLQLAIARARPGYFLLVAKRTRWRV